MLIYIIYESIVTTELPFNYAGIDLLSVPLIIPHHPHTNGGNLGHTKLQTERKGSCGPAGLSAVAERGAMRAWLFTYHSPPCGQCYRGGPRHAHVISRAHGVRVQSDAG